MSEYVFAFSQARLAGLALALLLLLSTSFGGGIVATLAWQSRQQKSAEAQRAPVKEAAAAAAPVAAAKKAEEAPVRVAETAKPVPTAAAAPAAEPERPAAPVSALQLGLIVGSYLNPQNADRVEAELRSLGLEPQRLTRQVDAEKTWHAVRLGPYADWESASRFAAQVRLQTGINPAIRPY